jgi:hypothetical protein
MGEGVKPYCIDLFGKLNPQKIAAKWSRVTLVPLGNSLNMQGRAKVAFRSNKRRMLLRWRSYPSVCRYDDRAICDGVAVARLVINFIRYTFSANFPAETHPTR